MSLGLFLGGYTSESKRSRSRSPFDHERGDEFLALERGDCGTAEHELELAPLPPNQAYSVVTSPRSFYPIGNLDEDHLPPHDEVEKWFADDEIAEGGIFCPCNTDGVRFFPFSDHPDTGPDELCLCNARADFYEMASLATKRKAIAYDDDGVPLPDEWCAIIIKKSEARELMARAMLPVEFLER